MGVVATALVGGFTGDNGAGRNCALHVLPVVDAALKPRITSAIDPENPVTVALASTAPVVMTAKGPENVQRTASRVPWQLPDTEVVVRAGVGLVALVPPAPPHPVAKLIMSIAEANREFISHPCGISLSHSRFR
jgi:hypothetical protein